MKKSIIVNTKKRGRPSGQTFPIQVQLRLSSQQADAVDAAVTVEETTGRSELIRRVVEEWLQAKGYLKN